MAIDKLFSNLTSSPGAQGALGGAASGALVSLLMNKKARKKIGKGAVQLGGMAALAGVGYYAYQKWQGSKAQGAAGTHSPVVNQPPATAGAPVRLVSDAPALPVVEQSVGMTMILAMIAAANADGTIDGQEMQHLFDSIENASLTPSEKAQLTAALNTPPTLESITAEVHSEEVAAEIYGAALTAIDPDTPAEHLFLKRLASALRLNPGLVTSIHAQLA